MVTGMIFCHLPEKKYSKTNVLPAKKTCIREDKGQFSNYVINFLLVNKAKTTCAS